MLGNLTGPHLLVIAAILLLLFGAARLPALARSVGQSAKIFRSEMKSDTPSAEQPSETANAVPSPAPSAAGSATP